MSEKDKRRVERLENVLGAREQTQWQFKIVYVDRDGTRTPGPSFTRTFGSNLFPPATEGPAPGAQQ